MDPDMDMHGPGCPAGDDACPSDGAGWIYISGYRDFDDDSYTLGSPETVCSPGVLPFPYMGSPSPVSDCDDFRDDLHLLMALVPDRDRDGHGLGARISLCTGGSPPDQYVEHDISADPDCNDDDPAVFLTLIGHEDKDGDLATVGFPAYLCTDGALPAGFTAERSAVDDCNDDHPQAYPYQSGYFLDGMTNNGTLTHDYDCSGAHEFEYPRSCPDSTGFQGWGWSVSLNQLTCGSTGTWMNCQMQGGSETRDVQCH